MRDRSATNHQLPPLPDAEIAYLDRLVGALTEQLGNRLVGVYLFGSAAYGAYQPGFSDLDVQAVTTEVLPAHTRRSIAEAISQRRLPCPARKLEFVCYTASAIDPASRHPRFELNYNTGAGEGDHLTLDPAAESSHWFLLDIAMGRTLGRALIGPPPEAVFAPIPRLWVLEGIADSLAWHEHNERASANSVLNACRGWRYAATGVMGSKQDGAIWAMQQPECPPVVRQAEQRDDSLDPTGAAALIAIVGAAVERAILNEQRRGS